MAANATGGAGVTHEFALAFVAENTEKDEARSTAVKIFIENTVCTATFTAGCLSHVWHRVPNAEVALG